MTSVIFEPMLVSDFPACAPGPSEVSPTRLDRLRVRWWERRVRRSFKDCIAMAGPAEASRLRGDLLRPGC
jgi:hypothetical protein